MSDSKERRAKGAQKFAEVYKGILSADPEKPTGDAKEAYADHRNTQIRHRWM